MKNKTLATWITFVAGPIGLHRFYLKGFNDPIGWLLPLPTLLGLYGVRRAQSFGMDDPWIWLLIPLLGFTVAACALNAIIYGLTSAEKWNEHFNPLAPNSDASGKTTWFTIAAVVASLVIGATTLVASMAFSFQRYFEYQAAEVQPLTQPRNTKKSAG
jgi:multisubunit Na+/H+ antiporter MnhC subunit